MKLLTAPFLLLLFLVGCSEEAIKEGQTEQGRIVIQTPSSLQVGTICPSDDPISNTLCREARVLVLDPPLPATLMGCPDSKYYSIRVSFYNKEGQKKEKRFIWDCNTSMQLEDLRDAVEARARKELGNKAG
jgi:hypothetical protein